MLQEESFDPSFCADTHCRSFIDLLANSTTTECTISGSSVQAFINRVRAACSPTLAPVPVVTDPPPELPAQALSAIASPTVVLNDTKVASESQAPVSTPPPATGSSKTVMTLTVIGSIVIIALAVLIAVFVRRERKKRESNRPTSTHTVSTDYGPYTAYSDATTAEDTLSSSNTFPASHVLLPHRIPYSQIELGEVISHGGYGEVVVGAAEGSVMIGEAVVTAG